MNKQPSMQFGDWINAGFNVVLGVLLGVIIDSLAQLLTTVFWPVAVIMLLLFAGLFLIESALDKVFDWFLRGGIRPAPKSQPKKCKPILRLLSLPISLVLGVALARLGLGETLLGMIP